MTGKNSDRGRAPATETEYRIVEVSTVTEEELTEVINEVVGEGWNLDGINFAMRESSKRPAMAFVLFTRPLEK